MGTGPYTNDGAEVGAVPSYVSPLHSYAAPSLASGGPDTGGRGWSSDPTIDPQRAQRAPGVDFRPDPERAPEEWYRRNDRDAHARHSVESQDADGYNTIVDRKSAARDPRLVPPPEPRLTSRMSPRSYSFTRPFDQGAARQFNGMHFSMAEHRRRYPILGMAPPTSRRNTFRLDPAPWDSSLVDMPADASPTIDRGGYQSVDLPPAGNRSGRLG